MKPIQSSVGFGGKTAGFPKIENIMQERKLKYQKGVTFLVHPVYTLRRTEQQMVNVGT